MLDHRSIGDVDHRSIGDENPLMKAVRYNFDTDYFSIVDYFQNLAIDLIEDLQNDIFMI